MKNSTRKLGLFVSSVCLSLLVVGCANEPGLGHHVSNLRQLQTYDVNATKNNMDVIPDGSGGRMDEIYQVYNGKETNELKGGTESQFVEGAR